MADERVSGAPARGMTLRAGGAEGDRARRQVRRSRTARRTSTRITKRSATALAGQGLMGVAQGQLPARRRSRYSFVAGFAEVEVDVETGKYHIVDYLGRRRRRHRHPSARLGGQVLGGSMLGIGHAIGRSWVYDQHYGVPLAKRFHHNKPPTILDAPQTMRGRALNMPDPETPVGARGIGEPPVGAGCGAVMNAIADAVGPEVFQRAPVMVGTLIAALDAGHPVQEPLTAHI